MKKYFLSILSFAIFLYLSAGLYLYIKQRDMLYFPTPAIEHKFDTFALEHQGERTNIIVANYGHHKALIYFGGNSEVVAEQVDDIAKILPEYTIYFMEYRGYGNSSGVTTEDNIFYDAIALYDYVNSKHTSISVIGRSLGTGVASFLSSKKKIEKLVLITPFDSIANVAQEMYPMFPIRMILKDKYDSISRAPKIDAKTMILVASNDTVVPSKHAYKLASVFPKSQVIVHEIKNTTHHNIIKNKEYFNRLKRFLHER